MIARGNNQQGPGSVGPGGFFGHVDDWDQYAVDYLDGRLNPEDRAAVEQHLANCPACAARMATQQGVITFLQRTPLDEAPEDLRDMVLGELLFPSSPKLQPAFRGVRAKEPVRPAWTRRFRPWLPVTSVIAVVLIGIVLFGVLRPSGSSMETARVDPGATVAADQTLAAGSAEKNPVSTTAAGAATPPTTAAAVETTAAPTGTELTAASATPTTLRDRKQITNTLETAEGPAYIAFETVPTADTPVESTTTASLVQAADGSLDSSGTAVITIPADKVDEVASQITAFTGLERLPGDLSFGGPTFAAFVSRKQLTPFMDLLSSIKASIQVDSPVEFGLVLRLEPESDVSEMAELIKEHAAELPILKAQVAPQPAVNRYTFTTATIAQGSPSSESTNQATPDQFGTHILVVIFVRG